MAKNETSMATGLLDLNVQYRKVHFLQPLIEEWLTPNPIYTTVPSNELLLFEHHDQIRPENIESYLENNI